MKITKLVKTLTWLESERELVILGASVRLDPELNALTLKKDPATGLYSTGLDLFGKTKLTTPKALRQWIGFQVDVAHARDSLGSPITAVKFRLDNGTDEYFWNGTAWAVAASTDWNTEVEVASNIATFDVATLGRSLRVVVNLSTTNALYTPIVTNVKLLMATVIHFLEDILYRSLMVAMKAGIRPITNATLAMPTTGTTFNKSDLRLETGYIITGVDAVFDFDAEPEASRESTAVNLLASYAANTGIVTLTGSVPAGTVLWVRFIYAPRVAVETDQDYFEVAKLPGITLSNIAYRAISDVPGGDDHVTDKAAGTATVVPSPQQGDITITLTGFTDKSVDQQRLQEEINAFFLNNQLLTSVGIDEQYRLQLIDEYVQTGGLINGYTSKDGVHTGRATFLIKNFRRWLRDSYVDQIVVNPLTISLTSASG